MTERWWLLCDPKPIWNDGGYAGGGGVLKFGSPLRDRIAAFLRSQGFSPNLDGPRISLWGTKDQADKARSALRQAFPEVPACADND